MWKYLILRFMENVTSNNEILFLSLSVDMVFMNYTPV